MRSPRDQISLEFFLNGVANPAHWAVIHNDGISSAVFSSLSTIEVTWGTNGVVRISRLDFDVLDAAGSKISDEALVRHLSGIESLDFIGRDPPPDAPRNFVEAYGRRIRAERGEAA